MKSSVITILITFGFMAVFAATPVFAEYDDLIEAADEASLAFVGNESAQALFEYKQQVEAGAFRVTMRLCPLYRKYKGLPDMSAHYKSSVTLGNEVGAWRKILQEGAAQPFSAAFGNKAEYLSLTNTSIVAPEAWFGSLYTLYLIGSWGFLEAASHCLNTVAAQDFHEFAMTILLVDMVATGVTEVVAGYGIGKLIDFTIMSIRGAWAWTKLKLLPKSIVRNLGRLQIRRTQALLISIPLVDSMIEKKRQQEQIEKEFKFILDDLVEGVAE